MIRYIARLIIVALIFTAPRVVTSQHEGHGDQHHGEQVHPDAHEADHHEDKFVAGDFIMHHIADANEIHFFGGVSAPLPMIIYVEGKGLDVFMSMHPSM